MVYHTGRTSCHLLQWIGADQCTDHSVPVDGLSGSKQEIDQDCWLGNIRLFIMDWALWLAQQIFCDISMLFVCCLFWTNMRRYSFNTNIDNSDEDAIIELERAWASSFSCVAMFISFLIIKCFCFNVNYILEKKVLLSLPPWLSAQFFPYFA